MYSGMDKLDKWTVFFVIAMACYATALLATSSGPAGKNQDPGKSQTARQHVMTPELETKIQIAKNLLTQDNVEKSETLVNTLLTEFPYEGELFMLRGDLLMRRQQPIGAMYAYREAIQLNPDFLDKKTSLFQGKKIKYSVEEANAAIESGLLNTPGDSKLRNDREVLYFMKRKLAGSCG